MSSVCRLAFVAALACAGAGAGLKACTADAASPVSVVQPFSAALRVCADPNNMPFSNAKRQGFENQIADLIARELGRRVEYFWAPQRRGFVRNTLRAGHCDVIMGVPDRYELARPTRPYYRSTYVFVTRRDRHLDLRSLADARLRRLQIGIQIVGDDYANPPAAQALARRRITANVHGYTVYGDYSKPDPQRTVVDAVARGDVDVAIVWGPLAGYFAAHEPVAMDVRPLAPDRGAAGVPFAFDIAMAVRKDDGALQQELDRAIVRRRAAIRRILRSFGVPMAPGR